VRTYPPGWGALFKSIRSNKFLRPRFARATGTYSLASPLPPLHSARSSFRLSFMGLFPDKRFILVQMGQPDAASPDRQRRYVIIVTLWGRNSTTIFSAHYGKGCIVRKTVQLRSTALLCASGEDCVCYATLGERAKLSSGNPGPLCFACEKRNRYLEMQKRASKPRRSRKQKARL
jgi:hypothetical protein